MRHDSGLDLGIDIDSGGRRCARIPANMGQAGRWPRANRCLVRSAGRGLNVVERWYRGAIRAVAIGALVAVAGCGNVMATRNSHSYALDSAISEPRPASARGSVDWSAAQVTPISDGTEALKERLAMVAGARSKIDLKTFIFSDDPAGHRFTIALLEAADRGVAIRILVDDFFHYWAKDDFSLLAAHPEIEVRLFNPFSRSLPPPFSYLLDYDRVNRRMHGKVMVVDDRAAIVGGRNIGDEYFGLNPDEYFSDFDLIVRGEAVMDIRQAFVSFWADKYSVSYAQVAQDRHRARQTSQPNVLVSTSNIPTPLRGVATPSRKPAFTVGVQTKYDPPEKLRAEVTQGPFEVAEGVLGLIANARDEVLIVTPYFIPEEFGVKLLESLVQRGVRVRVLTNSLGATNHPSVHGAYLRYRSRLLKAGVEIFEYREDVTHAYRAGDVIRRPKTTMHTKLIVVDDRYTVVGSPNFDARSFRRNSEFAVTLYGRDMAHWSQDWIGRVIHDLSYRVSIGDEGEEIWERPNAAGTPPQQHEPAGRFGAALVAAFFNILPLDNAL